MNQITQVLVRDYRCFREEQTAILAPLTLLVGENSSGKTSFLALMRAMWDAAYRHRSPDFKEEPYDLGSYDEIAHHRGGKGGRAPSFEAELKEGSGLCARITFDSDGVAPVPVHRHYSLGDTWIEDYLTEEHGSQIRYGTANVERKVSVPAFAGFGAKRASDSAHLVLIGGVLADLERQNGNNEDPELSREDRRAFGRMRNILWQLGGERPFASAPVRSKPRRTYDPARAISDPEGDYVPMYLARVFAQDKEGWTSLKERLEAFGEQAGLFDEISIKRLGKKGSGPFHVQVRKYGGGLKGPHRNLIDVGYGVSQVLPIITELLRSASPQMFLLQQPEVHLHPSAQAALGSLFCKVVGPERQLIIETHSDNLIDRVRMDVRDRKTKLRAEDVSILYFERKRLSVHIHSIKLDDMGNVSGAPDGYRQFFKEETRRVLGI